jgi:hypothetical protein
MAHEHVRKSEQYDLNLAISLIMLITINVIAIVLFAYLGLYQDLI